jgi:multisubunit Na+/H+ antiporter MnhE subunit
MSSRVGAVAGAGGPKRRKKRLAPAQRAASWLTWWVLLMAFWVWFDDTLLTAELIVGAAVAALGAGLVELAQSQADSHIRMRAEWLAPAVKLPLKVARDTWLVFKVVAAKLFYGREPPSAFEEVPEPWGDDSPESATRRAVVVWLASVAPGSFALGIDPERDVMVVHRLVADGHRNA